MSKLLLITNAYNQYVHAALKEGAYDGYVFSCMSDINIQTILDLYPKKQTYDIYTYLEMQPSNNLSMEDFYVQMMTSQSINRTLLHCGKKDMGMTVDRDRLLEWVAFFEDWNALIKPSALMINIPVVWKYGDTSKPY